MYTRHVGFEEMICCVRGGKFVSIYGIERRHREVVEMITGLGDGDVLNIS